LQRWSPSIPARTTTCEFVRVFSVCNFVCVCYDVVSVFPVWATEWPTSQRWSPSIPARTTTCEFVRVFSVCNFVCVFYDVVCVFLVWATE
jgi:hypothetical protein